MYDGNDCHYDTAGVKHAASRQFVGRSRKDVDNFPGQLPTAVTHTSFIATYYTMDYINVRPKADE